jgi:hypothetical protein
LIQNLSTFERLIKLSEFLLGNVEAVHLVGLEVIGMALLSILDDGLLDGALLSFLALVLLLFCRE